MKSLGDLVDRLSILNLKIWNIQEWVHRSASDNLSQFRAENTIERIHEKVRQLAELNKERSRIMGEIDDVGGTPGTSRVKT